MSVKQWWRKPEYLWPRVATIARRRLVAQASSACSESRFSKAGLICARKRMMLKPEHVDALSLLGWHAMREKELLKQGEYVSRPRGKKCTALAAIDSTIW